MLASVRRLLSARLALALLGLGALGLCLGAPRAAAEGPAGELLVLSVERTAGTHERPRLSLRTLSAQTIQLRFARVNDPALLVAGGDDLRRPEGVAAALRGYELRARSGAQPAPGRAPLFEAARVQEVRHEPLPGRATSVDVDPLPAGLYRVEALAPGELRATALLLVSDLALVTKRDAAGLTAWAAARRDGAPQAQVEVRVEERGAPRAKGLTGPDGLVRLAGEFAPTLRVFAVRGADLAFGDEGWVPPQAAARRVWMVTHQPAYRPGERVEVKGVVRGVDAEGRPTLDPAATEARVRLVGPGERVLAEAAASIGSERGTFGAGLVLPADAPTGPGEVQAEIDGRFYAAPLLIDAYRRPPFAVTVAPASPRALVGTPVRFQVSARGYDGAALPGAPCSWELVFHRVERDLFPEDEFVRQFFGTERDAFAPVTLAHGQGVLGADATLEVTSALPALEAGGFATLRATVVGLGGMHVTGSGVLGVDLSPVTVALQSDRHLYGPEDAAHVSVRVVTAEGKPAAERAVSLALRVAGTDKPVAERALVTDARGEAHADLTLPGSAAYVVRAAVERLASEPPGAPATAERRLWAVGEQATLGYAGERLQVLADKDAYQAGDVARVLVLTPRAGRALLGTVEGASLLDARVLAPAGASAVLTVPLTEAHGPNAWVTFTGVDEGSLITGSVLLRIPPVARLLTTTVTPDAATLAPGATSGVTLRVTDAAGQPVAGAEVCLAVVDEALHALFPDPGASLPAFFHPLRRNGVTSGGPLHLASVGYAWRAPPPQAKPDAPSRAAAPSGGEAPRPAMTPAEPPEAAPGALPAPAERGPAGEEHERRLARDPDGVTSDNPLAALKKLKDDGGPAAGTTRADFRTAVFWAPLLVTGPDGTARAEGVHYADTLTRWRLTAHSVDAATRVGSATAEVRTKKDLAVDVTLPRFLRAGDRVESPVLLSNLSDQEVTGGAWAHWGMQPLVDEGGERMNRPIAPGAVQREGTLEIKPTAPGTVHVLVHGAAGPFEDTLTRSLPVLPQGIETAESTFLRAEGAPQAASRLDFALDLPRDVDRATLRARLTLERSDVEAVLAALPYLVDYPYGCTEQTLSRFEPLLVVAEAAEVLRLPRTGLLAKVPELVAAGVERLSALMHADGGYGWWPSDATNLEMTARAVRGLARATRLPGASERALALQARAAERLAALLAGAPDDAPSAALALRALAEAQALPEGALERALDTLGAEQASALTRALFLEAALAGGRPELAAPIAARLLREARRGARGAWFGPADAEGGGSPQRWQDDPVETTAVVLHALLRAGVRDALLADGARWLRSQRSGGEVWRSTRDTAAAVAFLAHHAVQQASEEASGGPPAAFRVLAGERLLGTLTLDHASLGSGGAVLDVSGALGEGAALSLRVEGTGAFAGTLTLTGFATGPAIAGRDAGLRVVRRWFRLTPVTQDGRVLYVRAPLTETVEQGALLECEVRVTSPRAHDYVQITDPHAAAFEPVRATALAVQREADDAALPGVEQQGYDDRTEFFVARLPAGEHVFRHVVRVTHAGAFTALPAQARLMYFPAVRGSSQGEVLEVTAAKGGAR